jgi:ABC-type transport system involved in multi-copper enzyme maturation permease subunit
VGLSFLLADWLRNPWLRLEYAKELREILPYWLVSLGISLGWLLGWPNALGGLALVAWGCGEIATVAMGAAMFGHEFSHRTMPLMLVQPVARRELWRRKMTVLGAAMAVIVVVRLAGPVLRGNVLSVFQFGGLMSVAGVAYGLLVAPWMTLLTRSTLAGTVFTVALPALIWQAVSLVVAAWFGADRLSGFLLLTLVLWAVGPFLSFQAFLGWEATALGAQPLRWPRWLTRSVARSEPAGRHPGRPWVKLAAKELRLQSPAFVVGGLYVLICGTDIALQGAWPRPGEASLTSEVTSFVTLFHVLLVSLLAGALACAEERATGVLPWHLTLPIALRTQWWVKVGVALAVALGLGVALPGIVLWLGVSPILDNLAGPGWLAAVLAAAVLCALGLYLSSLGGSTMRALLWGVPLALLGVAGVGAVLGSAANRAALWNGFMPFDTAGRTWFSVVGVAWLLFWGVVAAGLLAAVLVGASRNFRWLERRGASVLSQLGLFVLVAGSAAGVCFGASRAARAVGLDLPQQPERVRAVQAFQCSENLQSLEMAITTWTLEHPGRLPPNLQSLSDRLKSPRVLVCPADLARSPASHWGTLTATNVSYVYEPSPAGETGLPTAEVRCLVHGNGRIIPHWRAPQPGGPAEASDTVRLLMRYGLRTKPPQSETAPGAENGQQGEMPAEDSGPVTPR